MKAKTILAAAVLAGTTSLWALPITPGNVVIYRVGTGSGSLVNTGNPIFIDEFTTNGTFVQSIALPSTGSGANYPIAASGTATSDGMLTVSADGQYIMLTGYGTNSFTSSLTGTAGTVVPRIVARMDLNGNIDTSTALTNFTSGNNVRSVYSTDGNTIWVSGGATGIGYTTLGSRLALQIGTGSTNVRNLNGFGGQLYFSTGSGSSFRLATAGAGLPTTSGQVYTNLPGLPTGGASSPYSFVVLDLSLSVAGMDTLYYADDDANAIFKYSFNGTTWTSNGFVTARSVRGLTTSVGILGNTTNVYLFGTTGAGTSGGGGVFYGFDDVTGYNGALSGFATTNAIAAANTAFRGIAYVPLAVVPEPSTVVLVVAGLGAMLALRRRR